MNLRENLNALIENEATKIDKDGKENVVTLPCKIKFIQSARFMATSSSNLVYHLTEEIHKFAIVFLNMKVSKKIQ